MSDEHIALECDPEDGPLDEQMNPLLTTEEAAAYLFQSPYWLAYWRRHSPWYGPPHVKVGRRIYYRVTDLDRWIDDNGVPVDCWSRMTSWASPQAVVGAD